LKSRTVAEYIPRTVSSTIASLTGAQWAFIASAITCNKLSPNTPRRIWIVRRSGSRAGQSSGSVGDGLDR